MLGSLGSRMMEADTSSSTKDVELVDSGVDEEMEPPDEEAVFSDPDEEDERDITPVKSESSKEKDYEFKPIEKEGVDDNEEGDSNEDITELEDLENLGDELKELIIKFSQERYTITISHNVFDFLTLVYYFNYLCEKLYSLNSKTELKHIRISFATDKT